MANDLSILFSKDGFSFYVFNNGDLIHQESTLYTNREIQETSQLINLTQQKALYWKQKYNSVNIILYSTQFNIVPNDIFSQYKEPEFWLEFNTEIFENDPVKISPIDELKSVLVYSFASEILTSLEPFFDNYKIQHSLVPLLKSSQIHAGKRVYANLFLNSMEIMVIDDNNLILYNIYNVNTKEDFAYYILNTYKTLNLNTVENTLYYNGSDLDDYIKMLSNFVAKIEPFNLSI